MAKSLNNIAIGSSVGREMVAGLFFLAIIALFYVIPNVKPIGTGTAYIILHLLLTISMVVIWQKKLLSVQNLLIVAILARVILLPAPLWTSNDVERYLWDGAVVLAGFDPYVTIPNDPLVQELRNIWPTPPEHGAYATLYPPGALLIFSLCAMAGPVCAVWVWKFLITMVGISSVFVMNALLKKKDLQHHLPLFALSPLLILETGIGAHLDAFLVLVVAVVLWALEKKRIVLIGGAIGIGAAIKFTPLIMLGPLFFALPIKKTLGVWVMAGVTVAVFYIGALLMGFTPIGVLPVFFEKWRFGAPIFSFLESIGGIEQLIICMLIILAFFVIASIILAIQGRIYWSIMVALAGPFIVSPVVFPWYLCLLVPVITLRPTVTMLVWVSLIPLTYEVLNQWAVNNIWQPALWPLMVLSLAIVIAFITDLHIAFSGKVLPCLKLQ